jgi:uncharacterized secreted protein with C-terminal beta-propeller domain
MKNTTKYFGMIFVLALLVFLVGCTTTPPSTPSGGSGTYTPADVFEPSKELTTKNFKSVAEFNDFVKKNSGANYVYYGGGLRGEMVVTAVGTGTDTSESKVAAAPSEASADYSKTNIQVEGVDEADIIKTDGNYIYTISSNTLFIIKAYPGEEAEIVSTIKFKNQPTSLFVNDNYLAVFGNFYDLDFFKEIDFIPRQGMTFFNIYDISDRKNPNLVKEYKFEGNYFQARMIENYVYFVTTTGPEYREYYPTPLIVEGTVKRAIAISDIYYYPIPYQSVQFATVHAIDITNPTGEINSKTIAVEDSQNMYMSENNMYITYTEYINEWELRNKIVIELMEDKLTESDKSLIEKIKQTDDEVLSQQEKESKILQIIQLYINYMTESDRQNFEDNVDELLQKKLDEYEYMEYTIINKISFDKEDISIDANGKVPGHIINQFSMDEYDNIFRIATTISQRWSYIKKENTQTESSNNVFALDENLNILSSLKGLAKGEQIYSTRFIGERLYMVTFRQVDPFFVIDLSNPQDIKELGKLKIPGFSRYLHPYDKDIIIGIGRSATDMGEQRGLKISLFDVSDVENPKEIAKFVTTERYAQSIAEFEHKAFLFSKEKELLVIPAYNYDYRCFGPECPSTNQDSYNGAMVFKINKNEITLRGIIDHSQGQQYYGPTVERSLYIEELLYTKSPGLLRINKIEDLSKVKNIELEGGESPYPIY